jgi:hypothetical protein
MEMLEDFYRTLSARYPIDGANMRTSQWLTENTHYGLKKFSFEGYQFQVQIADDDHPNLACIKCSQVGLALPLDTPLPTPTGWTTMGEVKVGDQLFDEQGRPTTVTFKSEVHSDHDCFLIEFDDGTTQVADAEHRWFVKVNRHPFNAQSVWTSQGRPLKTEGYVHEGVVDTRFLFDHQGETTFYIPLAKPLQLPEASLPLDPYTLGAWLGDGNRYSATLTIGDQDYEEVRALLARRGVQLAYSSKIQYRMLSQFGILRRMGMIGTAKRIPLEYQRASVAQRLELLRGLMDTDGSITDKGRASFHNTEAGLVSDVQDLLHGLGYKTRTRWRTPAGSGFGGKKPIAEVSFVPTEVPVFNLQRKASRQVPRQARPRYTQNRTIVKVTPVETVQTQCLTVDTPSHLFLAGRAMVPTHNTETQIRKFFAWLKRHPNTTGIFTLPSEKLFKRISKMRIKPWLATEDVFNSGFGTDKPARSMDMYQVDSSFAVISGLTEDDATSTSADILFHDELDLSDMKMIDLAQSRLQNSDWKITQAFSTPKYPGYGIDNRFTISDQHEYTYKCTACNHYNIPDFDMKFLNLSAQTGYRGPEDILEASDEHINLIKFGEVHVCCEKCKKPLDLKNHDTRAWVARHPARDLVRGYRVLPFSTHRIPPRYIFQRLLAARRENAIGGFHNTVLGRAYVDGNAQLSEEEIRGVMGQPQPLPVSKDLPCFLGIDVGETCHIVCGPLFGQEGGTAVMRAVQIHKLYETIAELHEEYNIIGGTIDRHPQSHVANSVHEKWPHILPCEYRGTAPLNIVTNKETDEVSHCQVDRTDAIDRVVKAIRGGTLQLEGFGAMQEVLITHLRNMVREEQPETPARWIKLAEEDHFFHALVFFLIAPRMTEMMFDYVSSAMVSSYGIIGVDEIITQPGSSRSDFTTPEASPLSVRARMTSKGSNLWRV